MTIRKTLEALKKFEAAEAAWKSSPLSRRYPTGTRVRRQLLPVGDVGQWLPDAPSEGCGER